MEENPRLLSNKISCVVQHLNKFEMCINAWENGYIYNKKLIIEHEKQTRNENFKALKSCNIPGLSNLKRII